MRTHFNLEKLIKIKVYDFANDTYWQYKRELKLFGQTCRREGVYGWGGDFLQINELENRIIKDGEVLLKPRCELSFQDNHNVTYWHEDLKLALDHADKIKSQAGKWINVESY